MPFEMVRNDITKMRVDAIVNAVRRELSLAELQDCAKRVLELVLLRARIQREN